MNKTLVFIVIMGFIGIGFSQSNPFPFASKNARENLLIKLKDSIINPAAKDFLANKNINLGNYSWSNS